MEMWLLLGILGGFTYFIVKRSVAKITTTPIWLIWFVLMTPALIWTGWMLIYGEDTPMPAFLLIGPFVICPFLYWWLVQKGRVTPQESPPSPPETANLVLENLDNPAAKNNLKPITAEEEKSLRDCFPWGIYYLQNIDYRPQAILCRGKLRAVPEEAYQVIKNNVEKVFGDRFLLLFQESFQGQPFFALVTNPWQQKTETIETEKITRPFLALGLLLLTLLTTTVIGAGLSGITSQQLENNSSLLLQGFPYSLGLIAILGLHEFSHYLTAVKYKIKTTLPYFIPIPFFLGTFGAFIQMRSPVPTRKALFDVAVAGPLGGIIIAIPLLFWGLSLSEIVPLTNQSSLLNFQALNPQFSLLLSIVAKLALGSNLIAGKAINLHPLAVAGYVGIIVTALNLMPVGQLDGGHIVHAMYGQKTAIIIGQLTRLFMFILALVQPDFLLWAIILLLMPVSDQPALNDVTELDNKRDLLGLFSLALLLSILLPLPEALARWWGM
ncbi:MULTISPECIES: site-2 protease family protein [unclassified Microcystis]|jgi:membrane-associated protease RseP (regulator of RpoE activity)|uniref:site-2 protease family protein n=1 Tax=unclassified Microcystis TaxID=2643300 RepID=UPI0025891542|nr:MULTISPECIES: site-2 protease family protein [unclassified Microcystis]MCA2762564.1 site-2 protease family protein [Microcystis sp. M151S2]MCA2642840.1 site-2 protease family protein [Microcystis sp. M087S2]MCA2671992.1 site-2 protease family protein [Microcystis sp. M080S2]MCA2687576.1 site-2 protease family protein [Microcystis sp. M037S2]MCA2734201.1 site-2 protease family protein [Microcystis sp. M158S2]